LLPGTDNTAVTPMHTVDTRQLLLVKLVWEQYSAYVFKNWTTFLKIILAIHSYTTVRCRVCKLGPTKSHKI